MTRFARAKGSKASNERAPEEGTPWEVMKEQLITAKKEGEESKKRQEAEQQRIQNYENFLQERKVKKRPATWCDFPEAEKISNTIGNDNKQKSGNKKKIKQKHEANDTHEVNGDAEVSKKKKNKQKLSQSDSTIIHETSGENMVKTNKKKKKRKLENEQQINTVLLEINKSDDGEMNSEPSPKKKKKKNKQKITQEDSLNEKSLQNHNSAGTTQVCLSPKKKKKNKKPKPASTGGESTNNKNMNESEDPIQETNHNHYSVQWDYSPKIDTCLLRPWDYSPKNRAEFSFR